MSHFLSRADFIAKVNGCLHQGFKLLVGKESGKGGGGRPIVELKDAKIDWYMHTLKTDSTHRFGNIEILLLRDAEGKIERIHSDLLEKILSHPIATPSPKSDVLDARVDDDMDDDMDFVDFVEFIELLSRMNRSSWKKKAVFAILKAKD